MSTQFYERISDGEFEDDDSAARYFFGEEVTASDRRYKSLKKRFYDRLVNTVFFIDASKSNLSDYQQAYYNSIKKVTAAEILFKRGQPKVAVNILKKCLPKIEKFEFFELKLKTYKLFKLYYGFKNFNLKAFDKYSEEIKRLKRVIEIEETAVNLHVRAQLSFVQDRTDFEQHYLISSSYFNQLSEYIGTDCDTVNFQFHIRSLELMMYNAKRELEKEVATCERAIESFKSRAYYNPTHIFNFSIEKSAACLQLGRYEDGVFAAEEAVNNAITVTSYLRGLFFKLLNYLHTGAFDLACKVLQKAENSNSLKKAPENIQEEWRIANGYIQFLIEAGQLEKVQNEKNNKFRINKLINDLPQFSKDKRSTNIPILVLQILFFIVRQDFDQSAERMRAVDRYNSRYLLKDNTFRSNCFVKMLLCVLDANFNRVAAERKAKKYVKRLHEMPITAVKQNYETEYVPYEKLWEIVVSLLDNSHYLVRR
ncbi:MAG: hypothetical protein AAGI23_05770 [Bacteroidota bacterium]